MKLVTEIEKTDEGRNRIKEYLKKSDDPVGALILCVNEDLIERLYGNGTSLIERIDLLKRNGDDESKDVASILSELFSDEQLTKDQLIDYVVDLLSSES